MQYDAKLVAEVRELERLASPWAALAGVHPDQQAERLKRCNPRLYGDWPMPRHDHRAEEIVYG